NTPIPPASGESTNTDAPGNPTDPGTSTGPDTPTEPGGPIEPQPEPIPSLIGDVEFSVPSQSFRDTLTVELSASTAGEIRYTTDGSLPVATSPLYEEPLVLDRTTEVRARVFSDGSAPIRPSTALYVARDFDTTSNLPLLIIDGYAGGKPA